MPARHQDSYLEAMGIQRWVAREQPLAATEDAVIPDHQVSGTDLPGWDELSAAVSACTRCDLHTSRIQTVFGVGNRSADWLIVGEAPGADEDRKGEPFVGRAGHLLDEMLHAIGLSRKQVYIANILKCRPPGNRNPLPGEIACCREYLQHQIRLIAPRIILAVGGIAANALLESDQKVGAMRGRVHSFGDCELPLVVTYHPAYLLRSPLEKRKVWEDLQFATRVYKQQEH